MPKRILVIDDDHAVRDSFSLALEDSGFEIETAENGKSGLEIARNVRPDLVFLDLKMPEIDGVEVLKRLHKVDSSLSVYIVTAFHQDYMERLNGVMEEGISFELARKPLSGDQIRSIAHATLD